MIEALVDRTQFPILATTNYLASHSLGAVPANTSSVLQEYAQTWASEGILAWEGDWWNEVWAFTSAVERILHAPPESVVPCLNVTLGFAAVASALDYKERPRVVISDLEFTTTLPFWRRQAAYGAEIVVVPSPDGVCAPVEEMAKFIDERTRLVVTSHAFFRSGALQDLAALGACCRDKGAYWLVDGYQSFGAVPFSIEELQPDFAVGGCHKWLCGGPGGGFLYVRPELSRTLEPKLTGWFGLAEPFSYVKGPEGEKPYPGVRRFLTGTPNVLGLYAAREGLRWVSELGVDRIRKHSLSLTDIVLAESDARGFKVKTPRAPERRNGMVCLDFPGAAEVCRALEEEKILVDYRPDCGIRVSPHFYNNESDLGRFFSALDRLS